MLETMYYADEVRLPDELRRPSQAEAPPAEVEMATALVENLSEKFEPEKYDDTLPQGAARPDPGEGEGQGAAGAARSTRPRWST